MFTCFRALSTSTPRVKVERWATPTVCSSSWAISSLETPQYRLSARRDRIAGDTGSSCSNLERCLSSKDRTNR